MSSATPSRSSIPSSVTKSPKSVRFKEDEDAPLKPSVLDKLSITHLLALGALFRFLLILYGVYHDSIHTLKYTDVDYFVFSDAARYIVNPSVLAQGPLAGYIAEKYGIYIGSPYDRATYRYTPLLALLLLPNVNLQPLFGKFLFSAADSGIALLQYHSLSPSTSNTSKSSKEAIEQERIAKLLVGFIWILNPFVANISTRGSAESILGFTVILFLHLLQKNKINSAAIVFGLAVHLKLYPVIYASSVLAYLSPRGHLINLWQIRFAFISFGSFMLLNLAMYSLWGMPFVEHTYLYHLTRLDHRHNFSHYFYQIYLASAGSSPSRPSTGLSPIDIVGKVASSTFVPQLALSLGLGFFLTKSVESLNIAKRLTNSSLEERNSSNLPFVFLIQTMIFIAFNRVCTSQYFMWYLWFLPFVIPTLQNHKKSTDNHHKKRKISWKKGLVMLGSWIGAQALWLSTAYELEFLGRPVFRELWLAGVAFFIVNVGLVWTLIDQL